MTKNDFGEWNVNAQGGNQHDSPHQPERDGPASPGTPGRIASPENPRAHSGSSSAFESRSASEDHSRYMPQNASSQPHSDMPQGPEGPSHGGHEPQSATAPETGSRMGPAAALLTRQHGVGAPAGASYRNEREARGQRYEAGPQDRSRLRRHETRGAGTGTVAAAVLAAALLGGAGGAGIVYGLNEPSTEQSVSDQPVETRTIASADSVNWAAVAEDVRPTVVAIESMTDTAGSTGSGVIIDAEGHIITNHHVVAASRDIMVTLSDGSIIPAEIVGSDSSTDIAVLRLETVPDEIATATLGSSEDLVVGEPVVAIGNPLGLSSTVTTGIISALDRPVVTREDGTSDAVVTNAIQIDAAINPGNSGGPLFSGNGEVIGINSSIASLTNADGGSAGSIGLGFAIPIDLAERVATDLLENGSVDHAFIGVTTASEIVSAGGGNQVAARVVEVSPGSPAAEYGLQQGDAILSINGDRLASNTALTGYVRQYAPGETVVLEVARGGDVVDVELVLGQRE